LIKHQPQPDIPGRTPQFHGFWRTALAACRTEHDEYVIQMNEVRRCASAGVQRAAPKVTGMINEPGHPTGHLVIPVEEDTPC
jgi:hypothetical protein